MQALTVKVQMFLIKHIQSQWSIVYEKVLKLYKFKYFWGCLILIQLKNFKWLV